MQFYGVFRQINSHLLVLLLCKCCVYAHDDDDDDHCILLNGRGDGWLHKTYILVNKCDVTATFPLHSTHEDVRKNNRKFLIAIKTSRFKK